MTERRRRKLRSTPSRPLKADEQLPGNADERPSTSVDASGQRSVAARGDINGQVATGDYSINWMQQAERLTVLPPEALAPVASVHAPRDLNNVPYNELFVGRADALDRLDEALSGEGRAVVQAVHGLGGVGKSTLAAYWATNRARECNPRWWITADTQGALEEGLAKLAQALQPAIAQVIPQEALAERGLQWLATHDGWLLVLDNVTNLTHIQPLLARANHGRIVITSRRATGWHRTATSIRLDVLEEDEAVELFTRILFHDQTRQTNGAAEVCAALGYLPLAIEQAAAFCVETGTSPDAYLQLLADHPADLYKAGPEGGIAERTIARIWSITLEQFATDPLPERLLRLLSWFGPDSIPRALLTGIANPPALTQAIGRLAAHSMLRIDPITGDLAVHRLVQAVGRTADYGGLQESVEEIDAARTAATAQLDAILPPASTHHDPALWSTWHALLPHIEALASHTQSATDTQTNCKLFYDAAYFLTENVALKRAQWLLERALEGCQRILGSDHPDTLACRIRLAVIYTEHGDTISAIPLLQQCLEDCIRTMGENHPNTLTCRSSLAIAFWAAGDMTRSLTLQQQALADHERILGKDHPETLVNRSQLAGAYLAAGNVERALALQEQALTEHERIFAEDDPRTLACRSHLAGVYQAAGNLNRALPLQERALADFERVLGKEHPTTLDCRTHLAGIYHATGNLARAVSLYKTALADHERILGADYPGTLLCRSRLAGAYLAAGNATRALPLQKRSLADHERIFGKYHPRTLNCRDSLAYTFLEKGDAEQSLSLFQANLNDRERTLEKDHPDTLSCRNGLATAHLNVGNITQALSIYEKTLADSERVLGKDHFNTLVCRDNLANALFEAGDITRAISLYEQALADSHRLLGVSHPLTQSIRASAQRLHLRRRR